MKITTASKLTVTLVMLLAMATSAMAQQGPASRRDRGFNGNDRQSSGNHRRSGGEDSDRQGRNRNRHAQEDGMAPRRDMFAMSMPEILAQLELTDEQGKQVREIMQNFRKEGEQRRGKNRPNAEKIRQLRRQMAKARRDWDREAFEKAEQQLEELMAETEMPFEQLREKLGKVLSDEQMKKLENMLSPQGAFARMLRAVRKLDLSEQQGKEIDEIVARAKKQAKEAEKPIQKSIVYRRTAREIMELLNESQLRELHQMARKNMRQREMMHQLLNELDLTSEQRTQIREIISEETAKLKDSVQRPDPQQMREIHRTINQRIMDEVLTDAQADEFREKLREFARRSDGFNGQRGRGDGDEDAPRQRGPRNRDGRNRSGSIPRGDLDE